MGFVYFLTDIADVGPIKIGYSVSAPEKRMRTLQTGYPKPLKILAVAEGTMALEQAIHRMCAAYRLHGEWFERCPCVLEAARSAGDDGFADFDGGWLPLYIPTEIDRIPRAKDLYKELAGLVPGLRVEVVDIGMAASVFETDDILSDRDYGDLGRGLAYILDKLGFELAIKKPAESDGPGSNDALKKAQL